MGEHMIGENIERDLFLDFSPIIQGVSGARERFENERNKVRAELDQRLYTDERRKWYQTAFLERFVFLYDKEIYSVEENRYLIDELLDKGEKEFGGYDLLLLWHSYPRMGIDNRNQYDMYRHMPGGLEGLKGLIEKAHRRGVRVILMYAPWDSGTSREPQCDADAMGQLVKAVGADGVFLDTKGMAEQDFRHTMEQINPSIVYDPEVMPNPMNVSYISGSWQQIKEVKPPLVPTIRWLEPRFSLRGIKRGSKSRIESVGMGFFYGYGQVIWENIFGWYNPWKDSEKVFLKKCITLLKQHQDAFVDMNWMPFVKTLNPEVYANCWHGNGKTVYTLYNLGQHDFKGEILPVQVAQGQKCYDVWGNSEIETIHKDKETILAFKIEANSPGCIVISDTVPDYVDFKDHTEDMKTFEQYLGDMEEQNRFYSKMRRTYVLPSIEAHQPKPPPTSVPVKWGDPVEGMVPIEGGRFVMNVRHNVHGAMEGACYGNIDHVHAKDHPTQYFWLKPYYMDITEVTNSEFKAFLNATHYRPKELMNFLNHWEKPEETEPHDWNYPQDKGDHPVVWVDLEDARAYAKWAGKRLPTEAEWQYAAGGPDNLLWPWGDEFDQSLCNSHSNGTTSVYSYSKGASPFKCLDMSGNVWEWTESERDDGHTRYAILRGGSYYIARGSIWYTAGGAQPCDAHEKMLLMHAGLDRCATIGFRCVRDVLGE